MPEHDPRALAPAPPVLAEVHDVHGRGGRAAETPELRAEPHHRGGRVLQPHRHVQGEAGPDEPLREGSGAVAEAHLGPVREGEPREPAEVPRVAQRTPATGRRPAAGPAPRGAGRAEPGTHDDSAAEPAEEQLLHRRHEEVEVRAVKHLKGQHCEPVAPPRPRDGLAACEELHEDLVATPPRRAQRVLELEAQALAGR